DRRIDATGNILLCLLKQLDRATMHCGGLGEKRERRDCRGNSRIAPAPKGCIGMTRGRWALAQGQFTNCPCCDQALRHQNNRSGISPPQPTRSACAIACQVNCWPCCSASGNSKPWARYAVTAADSVLPAPWNWSLS